MILHAYEKLLNDMYQYLLDPRNVPEKGTNMITYSKQFVEDKEYKDEFWFDMNMGHLEAFKKELADMIRSLKARHLLLN